ncbi:MAG TPA: hypothetical protein VHA35_15770 [Dongiaceae bacterium]|nr:hypothetical protein [Dongiaceae bacterium]
MRIAAGLALLGVLSVLGCDRKPEHSIDAALACVEKKKGQGLEVTSAKLSCAKENERLFAAGDVYGLDGTLYRVGSTDYRLQIKNNSSKVVTELYLRIHPTVNGNADNSTVIAGHVGPIWLEPYASGQYNVRMVPAIDWGTQFSFSFFQVLGLDVPN